MIPLAVRLTGALDRAALEGALCDLVERHESLRTVFPEGWGCRGRRSWRRLRRGSRLEVTRGRARRSLPAALAAAAGRGLRSGARAAAAGASVLSLRCEPSTCCCWCCITSRATAGRCVRCCGTWRRCTGRGCEGAAAALPALPVQYADYTLWQQAVLGDEGDADSAIARQLAFWKDGAAGPAGADRAAGRPAAAGGVEPPRRACGAAASMPSCTAGLRRWRGVSGASLFMVLQAGLCGAADAAWGRAPTLRSAARSRAAPMRRWTSWSGSSSTRWCCAPTRRAIRASAS